MTIRTKLTLWYAGILFVSALLIGVLSSRETVRGVTSWTRETIRQFSHRPSPLHVPAPPVEEKPKPVAQRDYVAFADVVRIVAWCGMGAVILGLGGGWWLMRKALAPIATLTGAATRLHEGNLREQLPRTHNGDELDRLTEVFNAMTARLDQSFQRIREFTLHASHELKTPLTVLRAELETALREESLDASQRERLWDQLDEIQRLAKIVDGLTLLTKADAGQVRLQTEAVRLDELVREACEDAQVLGQPQAITVRLTECAVISIRGDRHRLRQLLLNLTDNAVKYNQPQGCVTIALQRAAGYAELEIANTGPGIAPETLPHVFERFFRGDPARSQTVDGCGLGLSIAQWIVTAHGGTITLQSQVGLQTIATVRLPGLEADPVSQPGPTETVGSQRAG